PPLPSAGRSRSKDPRAPRRLERPRADFARARGRSVRMSCRELERLFVADASEKELREHAAACRTCDGAAAVLETIPQLTAECAPPAWSPGLREALLDVPRRAITCSTADAWLARELEGDLSADEGQRLGGHRGRCSGCAAAAQALRSAAELERPQAAPWMAGRIAAALKDKKSGDRKPWIRAAWLRNPRAAIALAYAAASGVMPAGSTPADLARRAVPAQLRENTGAAIAGARTSAVDRIGAWEEKAMRTVAIWRGRAGGYGRAALSQAIQLVMKSDSPSSRSRSRNGEEKGALPKSENAIIAWRVQAPAQEQL